MEKVEGGKASFVGVAVTIVLVIVLVTASMSVVFFEDAELKREQRDLSLLNETARTIKEAITNDYTIAEDIDELKKIDVTLDDILEGRAPCKNLNGYMSSSLGFASGHGFEPVSNAAKDAKVYVRIKGTRVEVLLTKKQGGEPVLCDFLKMGAIEQPLKVVW